MICFNGGNIVHVFGKYFTVLFYLGFQIMLCVQDLRMDPLNCTALYFVVMSLEKLVEFNLIAEFTCATKVCYFNQQIQFTAF